MLAVLAAVLAGATQAEARTWKAEPAWISNVGVYRQHELVYQDYLYDDHGANTNGLDRTDAPFGAAGPDTQTPTDPRLSPAPLINWAGDFTYGSEDGSHIDNVADLTEFRVAADADAVHYLIRLGDLAAPDSSVVGMCVDEDNDRSTGVQSWPDGANFTAALGCDHLYTVFGTGADVTTADGTKDLASLGGSVTAVPGDQGTIDVSVPRAVADPGKGKWRYYVASGIWDSGNHAWVAPTPAPATSGAPVPTGGSPTAPNFFDLLSNNDEPNSTWDEEKQANDLVRADIVGDYLDVDFSRLASNRDQPDPRRTGVLERIYVSKYEMEGKRGIDKDGANFVYNSRWQPYAAVIPKDYYAAENRGKAWPYDQCLHPLGANHNVEVFYGDAIGRKDYNPLLTGTTPQTGYLPFTVITELVDRLGAVYSCVLGRGEGVGYTGGDGLVDSLEVADDMRAHYRTDPDRTFVHGVSLGAIGSWYESRLYPDRYAAAMPYIFTSGITASASEPTLANLYNLPVFFSIGTADEFAQGTQGDNQADGLERNGDEYVYLHYLGRQHEGRIESDFLPFVERLGYTRTRVKNPARVRFVFDPSMYSEKIPGDGSAYWVSGMKPRDGSDTASIDTTSLGRADQLPTHQVVFDGLYANGPKNYRARIRGLLRVSPEEFAKVWRPADFEPGWQELHMTTTPTTFEQPAVANAFTLKGEGLGAATLDTRRMALDAGKRLTGTLDGDGATTLTLLGAFGGAKATLDGQPIALEHVAGGVSVVVPEGHHVLVLSP
jgi:hypothetical protein